MAYRAAIDVFRKFGVEIECYGLSQLEVIEKLEENNIPACYCNDYFMGIYTWSVGKDGTINQPYPIEVKSPILDFSQIDRVEKVVKILSEMELKTDSSCALHVHWNVSDYAGWDIANLLKLYIKFEPVLDLLVAFWRRGNNNDHCRSLIKNNIWQWIDSLDVTLPAYQISKEFQKAYRLEKVTSFPSARHHKLNICAINRYGTVEFRQHQGTLDWEEIKNWILLTGQMVGRARDGSCINPSEKISLGDFIRTMTLGDSQLDCDSAEEWLLLAGMRDFYKKKYRKNKNDC